MAQAKVGSDIGIGCTLCARTCPEVFKMDIDKAIVHVKFVPQDALAICRQAKDDAL